MSNIVKRPQSFEPKDDSNPTPHVRVLRGKKTIDQWIADRLNDPDKDGPLTSLVLENMVGSSGQQLHVKNIGQGVCDPNQVGKMFYDIAQTYCQDLSGNFTFRILAFYGHEQPEAMHIFAVAGQQDPGYLSNESPTKEGLLSQGMGWSSRSLEMTLRHTNQLLESNAETLRVLSSANSRLLTENYSAFETLKDVMLQMMMQQNNMEFEKFKYERATKERQKFLGMIPPLVNTVTGKPVFPVDSENNSLVEGLADLDEEDLEKIASVIQKKPALLALFASRIEKVVDAKLAPVHKKEEKIVGTSNLENELGKGDDDEHE